MNLSPTFGQVFCHNRRAVIVSNSLKHAYKLDSLSSTFNYVQIINIRSMTEIKLGRGGKLTLNPRCFRCS